MNLGIGELALVMLVVFLLFGGKRLPETARQLGRGISDLRRSYLDVKRDITQQTFGPDAPTQKSTSPNVPANTQPRNATSDASQNS
ncbi:MAG: twin-arginine translocase TatA/TatE family subunit [bacterium]|nr:twin-arginine translocase TatA/TatE family subunit [bacterium]